MRHAANKIKTIHYDFRERDGVYRDINNPEHYTFEQFFHLVGIEPLPSYVDYCIINTNRCSIKYRRYFGIYNVYVTWY